MLMELKCDLLLMLLKKNTKDSIFQSTASRKNLGFSI